MRCSKKSGALHMFLRLLPGLIDRTLKQKTIEAESWNFFAWAVFNILRVVAEGLLAITRGAISIVCAILGWVLLKTVEVVNYVLGMYADFIIYFLTSPDIFSFPV